MLIWDVERTRSFTEMVNCEVQRAMSGGPPSTWAVFPRGTVVLFPEDAVVDVGIEASKHLRQSSPSTALTLRAYSYKGSWWVYFEESACGANDFCVFPVQAGQDVLDAIREGLERRWLDSLPKASCVSHNFETCDGDESDLREERAPVTLRQSSCSKTGLEQNDTATKQLLSNLFKK